MSHGQPCKCHGMTRKSPGYSFAHGRGGPRIDPANPTYTYDDMKSEAFVEACEAAHITPTRRQYRKWSKRRGAAYAATK